jgi:hypothetical protein
MKLSRFFFMCAAATCVASPVTVASASTHSAVPEIPEIVIVSQPFNIFATVNASFVLTPRLASVMTRNDQLEFLLHRRVASADSFRSIANKEVQAAVTDSISTRLLNIGKDNAGRITATVPINISRDLSSALYIPFEGVYPVTIRIVQSGTSTVLGSVLTFLNRLDIQAKTPKIPLSHIIRLAPPASFSPDGTVKITDSTRQSVRSFVTFLQTFSSPVTISLQPEMVAALSESTEPDDVALFLDLQNQMRQRSVIGATFMPLSPTIFSGLSLNSEFGDQLRLGNDTLSRLLPGVILHRNTWMANDQLSPSAIALLIQSGITSLVLTPSAQSNVDREQPPSLVSRVADTGEVMISVVSAYSPFETLTHQRVVGSQRDGYAVAAEILLERQDLLAAGSAASEIKMGLLSVFDGSAESSAASFAIRALAQVPGLTSVDYGIPSTILDTTPAISFSPSSLVYSTSRATALTTMRAELNAVVSMLGADDVRRRHWEYQLGLAATGSSSEGAEYLGALRDEVEAIKEAITVTTPERVTLSSRSGSIRLQVRNNSATDLTVRVRVGSAKLRIAEPIQIVTISAGTTAEVVFSATTKTNGNFPITVSLSTPEEYKLVIPIITITARVTAIAGLGQLVSISFLLVLLAWWWSNRRSARRESASTTTV